VPVARLAETVLATGAATTGVPAAVVG
jgi:hypothetical protein